MKFVIPLPPSKNDTHVSDAVARKDDIIGAVQSLIAGERGAWHKVKRAMRVIRRRSPEYSAYQGRARDLMRQQNVSEAVGEVRVSVTAFFPDRRGDMANIVDPLLDTLEGVAYANDRQVTQFGRWAREVDAEDPRVVVTVEPLEMDLFVSVDARGG